MKRFFTWLLVLVFILLLLLMLSPAIPSFADEPLEDTGPGMGSVQHPRPDMPGRPLNDRRVQPPGETPGDTNLGIELADHAGNHVYTEITWYSSITNHLVVSSLGNPARNVTMYTPTVMPPGRSCLEGVMVHWRATNDPVTHHGFGFWDWCGPGAGGDGTGGWQNFYSIDAAWIAKYGSNMFWTVEGDSFNDPTAWLKIAKVAGTNCWRGYFWNFLTFAWEQKSQSCGTSVSPWGLTGWAIFETYGFVTPTIPTCFSFWPNGNVRVIQFRGPYMRWASGNDPLVVGGNIPGFFTDGDACTNSDVWHYNQGLEMQGGPQLSYQWTVTTGP